MTPIAQRLALALFLLGLAAAAQQSPAPAAALAPADLKGNWRCSVDVQGQSWPVTLQIIATDDARPIAIIENLDPGDRPITAAVTTRNGKLHLELQGMDASFDGKVNPTRDVISGVWAFAGLELPCDLKLQKTP